MVRLLHLLNVKKREKKTIPFVFKLYLYTKEIHTHAEREDVYARVKKRIPFVSKLYLYTKDIYTHTQKGRGRRCPLVLFSHRANPF